MISLDWFRHKKITVMGLGVHGGGLGVAKWLVRHGAEVTVTDLKDQHALVAPMSELERMFLRLSNRVDKREIHRPRYVLGRHEPADFTGADMVVQNPGVPREHPLLALAKKSGAIIATDAIIFFSLCPFSITGVTGTKGKTTTTALLGEMARRADARTVVAGNMRVSMLDALDHLLRLAKQKKLVPPPIILELSSWQLEGLALIHKSPHISVVTNIMQDHLNRYRDIDDYAIAKSYAIAFQQVGDIAVLNADDSRLVAWGNEKIKKFGKTSVVWFGSKKKQTFVPVAKIKLLGKHNVPNVLAAAAAAHALGVPATIITSVAATFRGVSGRLEDVATVCGVRCINDTTATAPDAAIAALVAFPKYRKKIILIAGGADKNLDFGAWARQVATYVKCLVLFDGTATIKMEAALATAQAKIPIVGARSMAEAVKEAFAHARRGDIVLLSPGCASFGTFQHEFDRGDQFVRAIMHMKKQQQKMKKKTRQ